MWLWYIRMYVGMGSEIQLQVDQKTRPVVQCSSSIFLANPML